MSSDNVVVRPMICLVLIMVLISIHILAALTDLSAFFQLFLQSVICVYLGCFLSAKVKRKTKDHVEGETPTPARAAKENEEETMTQKDAYMFPVYASITLFSLYAAYKFLPAYWLNLVFTCHFTFIGLFCLASFIELPISKILPAKAVAWKTKNVVDIKWNINLIVTKKVFELELNQLEANCVALALGPSVFYFMTKNWIANNIFGIAFAVVGIENLSLPNFKTGFILLWILFFYDIFWVYGTDVMVTVAKSFDVPIKLIFPYKWESFEADGETPAGPKFSMLGLGDIVIPGIFVALCLKYDIDRRIKLVRNVHQVSTPIFNWCFGGYIAGIITTYFVMVYFQAAQPALLFLVPGCTGATAIGAFVHGEVKDMWSYEEDHGREKKPIEEGEEKTQPEQQQQAGNDSTEKKDQ